jgi:hypothetical protein
VEKEVNEPEAEQDTVPQLSVEVFRRTDEAERIISEAEEAAFKDM